MDKEKHIIKRIQKLLNLARGKNASEGEVKNAMEMAQRLMIKYKISVANLDETSDVKQGIGIQHEEFFSCKGSLNPADISILQLLIKFYRVRVIQFSRCWGGKGLTLVGTPEDIEIAKYVHGYLRKTYFDCWNNYKKENPLADRASYYRGLTDGISDRLREAEQQAKAEESKSACEKYEIVLVNTREAIIRYMNETFGNLKNGRNRAVRNDRASFQAGHAKGKTIAINKAIA